MDCLCIVTTKVRAERRTRENRERERENTHTHRERENTHTHTENTHTRRVLIHHVFGSHKDTKTVCVCCLHMLGCVCVDVCVLA